MFACYNKADEPKTGPQQEQLTPQKQNTAVSTASDFESCFNRSEDFWVFLKPFQTIFRLYGYYDRSSEL